MSRLTKEPTPNTPATPRETRSPTTPSIRNMIPTVHAHPLPLQKPQARNTPTRPNMINTPPNAPAMASTNGGMLTAPSGNRWLPPEGYPISGDQPAQLTPILQL